MNSQMTQAPVVVNSSSSPCWFVGAMINRGNDQTDRFIDEGIWEHDFDDYIRVLAQVRLMGLRPVDRSG